MFSWLRNTFNYWVQRTSTTSSDTSDSSSLPIPQPTIPPLCPPTLQVSTHEYPELLSTRFYYLSLQKEYGTWTIHGLWPQISYNSYPTYCRKVTYSHDALLPILSDLETNWCSNQDSNDKFWEHEWKKHGSCMFHDEYDKPFITEYDYFNKALTLFHSINKPSIIMKYANGSRAKIPFSLDFKRMPPNSQR